MKKDREKAMKDMEQEVKNIAKSASALKSEVSKLKSKRDALSAELNAMTKEMMTVTEQITGSESSLARLMKEADNLSEKFDDRKKCYDKAKQVLEEKQQELNACSKEIKLLITSRDKHLKAAQNASLDARKVQHKMKQLEKDFKDAKDGMKILLKQHPWIEKEKAYFGIAGSDFDFASKDIAKTQQRLKELKADQVT